MLDAPCPQCGAPLRFRSIGLPVIVCGFCRSSVLRTGADVATIGTSAAVPDAVTPLCIGTSGRDGGRDFTLVGCIRWLWGAGPATGGSPRGSWTEWLMLYADSSHGWLAEAGGRVTISRRCHDPQAPALMAAVCGGALPVPGSRATLAGRTWRVIDARGAVSAGSDGELPFAAPPGTAITGIDLGNGEGGFASVQGLGHQASAYVGRYVRLRDLSLRGLRAIEGWAAPEWARA